MKYPDGNVPELSDRYLGRPQFASGKCPDACTACVNVCPVVAIGIENGEPHLDTGRCLFCGVCADACSEGILSFSANHRLSAARRDDLVINRTSPERAEAISTLARNMFSRSLKLRQVSAGGCNACEMDSNVLGTPAWDMGRFGIQFVASPRHADGLLITGPVSENMRLALKKTYEALLEPRIVIACGACAINGGPFIDHPEAHNGADSIVPVDLYIPGCPPHPLTILDGLLRFIGRNTP